MGPIKSLVAPSADSPYPIQVKKRIIKELASLKLAVITIVALAAITAWGTIVESQYDAQAAAKIVYHSVWMYGVLGFLCINLTAVMIDRWPWQRKHTGFVLAHIGIITLIGGSVVTRYYGIDGSLAFGIGEENKFVTVEATDLTVYSSMDGSEYRKVYDRPVDFFSHRPSAERPVEIPMAEGRLAVIDYMPYALREAKIVASTATSDGAAVRFQLQNANVNMTDWIMQPAEGREATRNLGPAQVILSKEDIKPLGQNAIVLTPQADGETLNYAIYSRREELGVKRGVAKAGDVIETGWMGMVLRVLKFMPRAKEEVLFHPEDRPSPLTLQAIKVRFQKGEGGAVQEHWAALNSLLKIFTEKTVYIVTFANRRLDLGAMMNDPAFSLRLLKFEVGRYQGTLRASSYQSLVDVPGQGPVLISMNEPLKFRGFTFYQASFNEDEAGRPVASILSVNRDPGRWIKYLGSLLIVFGTIHMFYFKKQAAKKLSAAAKVAA